MIISESSSIESMVVVPAEKGAASGHAVRAAVGRGDRYNEWPKAELGMSDGTGVGGWIGK